MCECLSFGVRESETSDFEQEPRVSNRFLPLELRTRIRHTRSPRTFTTHSHTPGHTQSQITPTNRDAKSVDQRKCETTAHAADGDQSGKSACVFCVWLLRQTLWKRDLRTYTNSRTVRQRHRGRETHTHRDTHRGHTRSSSAGRCERILFARCRQFALCLCLCPCLCICLCFCVCVFAHFGQ